LGRFVARDEAAFDADDVGRQAESGGGDAAHRFVVRRAGPVGNQSVRRVGQFPEEVEMRALEIVQQRFVHVGRSGGRDKSFRIVFRAGCGQQQRQDDPRFLQNIHFSVFFSG